MIPAYEAFMRPLLEILATGPRSCPDAADRVADALGLESAARAERSRWDGVPVVETRVRKAAEDLAQAGLVTRIVGELSLSSAGRESLPGLPARIDVPYLQAHFPQYAAYREELLKRRGA
ncbi:MAG: winged helix-turn-helix domain-containing protein [Myxococcota bacterium]